MGGGFLQGGFVGQDGVFRVRKAGGSGRMPQGKDAAHGHVHGVVRQFIIVPAVLQQANHLPVHLHRANPGMVVDGFQVIQALIVVVDVEQPVVI